MNSPQGRESFCAYYLRGSKKGEKMSVLYAGLKFPIQGLDVRSQKPLPSTDGGWNLL